MNPLTFSIPLDREAWCPICSTPLIGQVIWVWGCVVFCKPCIDRSTYYMLERVCQRCHGDDFAGDFVTMHGLLVLSPRAGVHRKDLTRLFTYDNEHGRPFGCRGFAVHPEKDFRQSFSG